MKKLILTLCGATLLMGTACKSNKTEYSAEDKAFGDSLAVALGQFAGAQEHENLEHQMMRMSDQEKANFDKAQFMKGLELVLNTDTANMAFLNGLYTGLNLYNPITQADKQAGVPIDAKKVIAAFKEVYMQDSIANSMEYRAKFQALSTRINERVQAKKDKELMESEESQANIAAGKKYIADRVAEGYQKTESGLVYKIINPGASKKLTPADRFKLRYVGKHVNDSIFDQTGEQPMDARVTNFIPGFTEGLQLLGEGGSAILVIPAELAYGLQGAGSVIGPNETLVFEVSVSDVESAE